VDDTPIAVTSIKPTLLVSYRDSSLNDLQRLLSEWIIAINASNRIAIIFVLDGRRFIQPRPISLYRERIKWA
jgi:hypothetical protein